MLIKKPGYSTISQINMIYHLDAVMNFTFNHFWGKHLVQRALFHKGLSPWNFGGCPGARILSALPLLQLFDCFCPTNFVDIWAISSDLFSVVFNQSIALLNLPHVVEIDGIVEKPGWNYLFPTHAPISSHTKAPSFLPMQTLFLPVQKHYSQSLQMHHYEPLLKRLTYSTCLSYQRRTW